LVPMMAARAVKAMNRQAQPKAGFILISIQ
jgi:hypothetical protein